MKMSRPQIACLSLLLLSPAHALRATHAGLGARQQRAALRMQASVPEGERVAVVLLAGGSGSRMKADRPKQFLELRGKPVLEWSIELLLGVQQLTTLVLVIAEEFRAMDFVAAASERDSRLIFADPGKERQDSVSNGLNAVPAECTLVAVHDAARPLVSLDAVHTCLADGATHGAAVLAVPMKATVKEGADGFVTQTLDRSKLWEIQTPQVVRPQLLRDGFAKVREEGWVVTDDVSIVEQMGEPVKLTLGEYTNLKLTTPEDMIIAETILKDRGERHQ